MATEEVQEEGEAAEGQTNGTEDPIARTQGVWLTSTPPFRPLSLFVHCSIPLSLPTCVLFDHIRRLNPGTESYDDKRMLRTRRPRESQRTAPWTQDKQIRLVYRDFLCPLWSPP